MATLEYGSTYGSVKRKDLNKVTEGLALMSVDDLKIDKLKVNINGSNTRANGTFLFAYHDLKITALKKNQEENGNHYSTPDANTPS